ncbi:hypothetical protein EZV73_02425 [Acidaminobacter sp. JC074]|uniref:dihydroorotase n=1 Tax=Acidaminobacter sp. JC074 TaxID=2530199 RepID=UPI001F0E12E3|nr:dihydroorotase family protein [Acidaminobacter sp. JC074]MCH4886402.1 hypothetical protein [Acidaminobacter sp. JC074]
MFDKVIISGQVMLMEGLVKTNIGIKNGKIDKVDPSIQASDGLEVIDASGKIVFPGGIDAHIHCEDGTVEEREDFYHLTKGCASSGITTALIMPTPGVLVNSKARFNERVDLIDERAYIDYGLIGGAGSDNLDSIKEQADAGVVGFKTFCCNPEWEGEDTEGCCSFSNGSLIEIMQAVKETGLIHALHVQDMEISDHRAKTGNNTLEDFVYSLDSIVETSGVASALAMSKYVNAPVHFCHISYKDSLELIYDAKRRNQDVTCEVLTLNLEKTNKAIKEQYPYIMWYPLPGSDEDKNAIYNGIDNGTVDMVNSDHSPFTKTELEESVKESIYNALPGGTNLEVTLPLLLHKVNEGILTLSQVHELFMVNPAKRFNLYPQKGVIMEGSDADLVLIDMNKEKTFVEGDHHIRCNYTQIDGMTLKGNPVMTLLRGQVIMQDGQITGKVGYGQVVKPKR